jgi:hypothetical protein
MVRDTETPVKYVTVNISADDAMGGKKPLTYGLYGHWQTDAFARPALTADGRIPVTSYGRIYYMIYIQLISTFALAVI